MLGTENRAANAPVSSWNYRVIEFVTKTGEAWRSIHEVHYVKGSPRSYIEHPTVVEWNADEGDTTALAMLARLREAVLKPVLVPTDFHTNDLGRDEHSETRGGTTR